VEADKVELADQIAEMEEENEKMEKTIKNTCGMEGVECVLKIVQLHPLDCDSDSSDSSSSNKEEEEEEDEDEEEEEDSNDVKDEKEKEKREKEKEGRKEILREKQQQKSDNKLELVVSADNGKYLQGPLKNSFVRKTYVFAESMSRRKTIRDYFGKRDPAPKFKFNELQTLENFIRNMIPAPKTEIPAGGFIKDLI
jgi:chromatin remodeling complex protein RSC6